VRRAYRRLAQESHPDTNGPAGLDRFISVQSAYEAITLERQGAAYGPTGAAIVPRSAAVPDRVEPTLSPPPPPPPRVDLFDALMQPSVADALRAYLRQLQLAPQSLVDVRG
jgi:curved DNA-binding protein CbpA